MTALNFDPCLFDTDATTGSRPTLTNEMAARYLPRVQRHALRIARRLPAHVQLGDLVSAGLCGLVDAFMKFDTQRMKSFDAYVDHRIRGAILDELRVHDPLTRDQRVFSRRLAAARHSATHRLGHTPDEHELATEMGMTLAAFRAQMERMFTTAARTALCASFDPEVHTHSEPANDSPDSLAAAHEERGMIDNAVGQLSPRQQEIVRMHYDEGRTLREIGEVLGITESRVSQLHAEAVGMLRMTLVSVRA
jgi:RNA polymerase sigma factor for flagellar operon FliA